MPVTYFTFSMLLTYLHFLFDLFDFLFYSMSSYKLPCILPGIILGIKNTYNYKEQEEEKH